MPTNPIVHWEIMGDDAESQKAFYGRVFDWTFEPVEGFENYHMVASEDAGLGGAVGRGSDELPGYITFYVQVTSIDDSLDEIEEAGGKTIVPRTEIPGTVTFALFNDPAGNLVGLVEEDVPES